MQEKDRLFAKQMIGSSQLMESETARKHSKKGKHKTKDSDTIDT
jgi:hypothetical protein